MFCIFTPLRRKRYFDSLHCRSGWGDGGGGGRKAMKDEVGSRTGKGKGGREEKGEKREVEEMDWKWMRER